jgi:squalene monooxygenase
MIAIAEGKFKVMPNHLIPAKPFRKTGVAMIGDSLNMRHPLTGGGMTAAFSDILNLGKRLLAIENFADTGPIDEAVQKFYASRHKQNATINILADALYGVMQNEDLKTACYDYLKSGGKHALEPIAILSAISRDEQLLLRHFFAVAFYGVGGIIKPFPTRTKVGRSYKMLKAAVDIVQPLVMNEHPGLFTRSVFRMAGVVF